MAMLYHEFMGYTQKLYLESIPFLEKQKVICLYTITFVALVGSFFNLPDAMAEGDIISSVLQALFLACIMLSNIIFWISRKLKRTILPLTLAVFSLMLNLVLGSGGNIGLGLFYIIPAYPVLYLLLGFSTGTVLVGLFYVGMIARLFFGHFGAESIYHNPEIVFQGILIITLTTILGISVSIVIGRLILYLSRLVLIDQQTLLPTRWKMEQFLETKIDRAERDLSSFSVAGIQVLNDNRINAMLGTAHGDRIFKEIGARIRSCGAHVELNGRWNSSLFFAVLDTDDFIEIDPICRHFLEVLSAPYIIDHLEVSVVFTITITRYPDDAITGAQIASNLLTFQDKNRNLPGELVFFNQEKLKKEQRLYAISAALSQADYDAELHLDYQPKVHFSDKRCVGSEVLMRWIHPVLGSVSPAEFIPVAEENGQIRKLTRWMIARVVRDLSSEAYRNATVGKSLHNAINLSVQDLKDQDLIPYMLHELEKLDGSAGIELEITEGVLVDDNPWIRMNLEHLRELGFKLAIDDFGTGYSSLSYLHKLNVNNLKIDQSFVRTIMPDSDERGVPIVDAIISMAKSLSLEITAEGVESKHQSDYLTARGCDTAQGWLFSKSLRLPEYIEFIKKHG